MAGGNLSPRQQMINMMYLVLTALLALNISKEVLDSFLTIDSSLALTNASLDGKVKSQMASFQASYEENPGKVGPYMQVANQALKISEDFYKHVELLKNRVVAETEGLDSAYIQGIRDEILKLSGPEKEQKQHLLDSILSMDNVERRDSYDECTNLLIGGDNDNPRKGAFSASELRIKLNQFNADVASLFQDLVIKRPVIKNDVEKLLRSLHGLFYAPKMSTTVEGDSVKWEVKNFYHIPLVAVHAKLTKIQTDIKTAESDLVKYLYSQVDAASFKFNVLKPAIIPQSNFVTQGDSFRADIFIAAYDSTNAPEIWIGEEVDSTDINDLKMKGTNWVTAKVGSDGLGKYAVKAGEVGSVAKEGIINYEGPDGVVQFPFSIGYQVAAPSLVVSPTKMNVLYRGLKNPVSVSVPGFPADKLSVSFTNASVNKGRDGYMVSPGNGRESTCSVQATLPNGSKKNMGEFKFRVKRVPDPKPYFAGVTGSGPVSKSRIKAAKGVIAKLEDFQFEGVKYTVTSFKIFMTYNGKPIQKSTNGNALTGEMKTMMAKAKSGQKIFIEDIRAKGPDGSTRKLGGITIKVQ